MAGLLVMAWVREGEVNILGRGVGSSSVVVIVYGYMYVACRMCYGNICKWSCEECLHEANNFDQSAKGSERAGTC